jgi:hypothetical protein
VAKSGGRATLSISMAKTSTVDDETNWRKYPGRLEPCPGILYTLGLARKSRIPLVMQHSRTSRVHGSLSPEWRNGSSHKPNA